MKNILFELKKIKLWNKWHFVENKPEIMQHALEIKYTAWLHILGMFFYMRSHKWMQVIGRLTY